MEIALQPTVITKELILNNVSEETLMEHYLGLPVRKGLFKSPLRQDNKPTCAFYRNNKGDLIFKDFRGDFQGNFISVVMYKFQCSYGKALGIIANDFGIVKRPKLQVNPPLIKKYTNNKFEETSTAVIQVEIKDFEPYELNWWLKYGITKDILHKFKIFSCKNVFLNGNIFHLHKRNQLVFGYYGGKIDGIEYWRIYFPGKKYKFISNWKSFRLQGAHALPINGGDYLVITKSLKDVACLYSLNIPAIAPISENCFVTDKQYEKLANKFKNIILLYDNDLAGINNANKYRKRFKDVYPLWIPRKYKAKDISDFYKLYGKDKTVKLIEQAKDLIDAKNKKS